MMRSKFPEEGKQEVEMVGMEEMGWDLELQTNWNLQIQEKEREN